jgi:hypothetical protein
MRLLLVTSILIGASMACVQADNRMFRLAELGPSPATLEYTRKITVAELAKLGFQEGQNLSHGGTSG